MFEKPAEKGSSPIATWTCHGHMSLHGIFMVQFMGDGGDGHTTWWNWESKRNGTDIDLWYINNIHQNIIDIIIDIFDE